MLAQERLLQIQARPPRAPRIVEKSERPESPADVLEEDSEAGAPRETAPAAVAEAAPAPFDDDGPSWPDASAESAFLAEQGPVPAVVAKPKSDAEPAGPLPTLDVLVSRIPAAAKATLDELFRARFVSVRRIPSGWLKE